MTTPSHIGQYRILRKIGAGGMGMVFLGEHRLLGRRAAIKTLLPNVAANREIVERFFNEARATSAISDPGVIQVFDFGYHVDGTAYIVMELLEGEALSTRIDRMGKLSLGEALRIARQLAGSLSAAHACDIVHRDLKPENVFLVADAEAQGGERTKILDFGICKIGAGITGSTTTLGASAFGETDVAVTQIGAMVGTPVYMSPEQCRGTGEIDHRSDVYAFGCLLFHMITGRPPFIGEASGELVVAHLNATPPIASELAPGLPAEIDALLERCLAKSPDDRYQSMAELQLALGDIYVKLDSEEMVAATVAPALSLGRGFRSVYQANLTAALLAHQSHVLNATRQLRLLSTPPGTPPTRHRGEDDDDVAATVPPRSGVRALLACVLVTGVVLGLVATSYTKELDGELARSSAAMVRESAPATAAAPGAAALAASSADPAADPAIATATHIVSDFTAEPPSGDEAEPRVVEPGHDARELESRRSSREASSRESKIASKTSRMRSRSLAAQRPASPPAPAAPSIPTEDLYDTR